MKARDILIFLAIYHKGNWDAIYQTVRNRRYYPEGNMKETLDAFTGNTVTILDKDYPESMRNAIRPPFVLFYKGDLSLLKRRDKCVSIVGSRHPGAYSQRLVDEMAASLAEKGYHIVSGMARGIDGVALRAAMNEKGKGIAFLGGGIDVPYPEANRDLYERLAAEGLVLSEYPLDTKPLAQNFPFRNRLIAAASSTLIVGECGERSGTLSTVNYAAGTATEVGVIPFEAGSGTINNRLIKEGAALLEGPNDALSLVGYEFPEKCSEEL